MLYQLSYGLDGSLGKVTTPWGQPLSGTWRRIVRVKRARSNLVAVPMLG